jgi:hypothetical protein
MQERSLRHSFIFIWILILILGLCIFGCKNPFRTRESPPPIISEGTWETPSQPEIVIQNLLYSYNERIIGNFIQCLADSFRFSDRSVELSVTTRIFDISRQYPDSISYVLSFKLTPPVPDDIGDSIATLSREYELLTISGRSAPPESTLAKGLATFWMRETSLNWWSIYLWKDIAAVANTEDWADFKAQFRQ